MKVDIMLHAAHRRSLPRCSIQRFAARSISILLLALCLLLPVPAHGAAPHIVAPQLPGVLLGANVDMGVLLPGSPEYLNTTQGDLFTIAQQAGLNAFRITDYDTWGPGEMDRPYSAAEWHAVGLRASATHLWLVPELKLSAQETEAIDRTRSATPRDNGYVAALESFADRVLGQAGLASMQVIAMIDLGNEEPLTNRVLTIYQAAAAWIHQRYPQIAVTIGGWRVAANAATARKDNGFSIPSGTKWVYNYPNDGVLLAHIPDVISVHIYGSPTAFHASRNFYLQSPAVITQGTLDYLTRVATWAGGKPIVIEEFGGPDGLLPGPRGVNVTPASQAALLRAVVQGMVLARQRGIDVMGALAWILTPRGGPATYGQEFNSDSLIIPQGRGMPLEILPGLAALCPAALGVVVCPAPVTGSAPIQLAP
jgi:hypothetical protein